MYGSYSFLDKMSNGIVLYFLSAYALDSEWSLRIITSILPIFASIMAYIMTKIGRIMYAHRMRNESIEKLDEDLLEDLDD